MNSSWFRLENELPDIGADVIARFGDFTLTNTVTSGLLTTAVVSLIALIATLAFKRSSEHHVSNVQIMIEYAYVTLEDFVTQITQDTRLTYKILPLITTIFVYVALSNIIVLFPPFNFMSVETEGGEVVDLFITHTSDISVTFGIGASLVLLSHLIGLTTKGAVKYVDQYFPIFTLLRSMLREPLKFYIHIPVFFFNLFLGMLDLIGEIGKSISLSFRLFGNMFAGDLMMKFILGSFAILIPAVWGLYGLVAGGIQAIVFAALVSSYFATQMSDDS